MDHVQRILKYFSIPGGWADEESRRKAEVLHITHLFIFFGGFLYLFVPSWLLNGEPIYVLVTISISVIGSFLLRMGKLKASGIWTIGALWLLFTTGSSTEGGVTSGSFAGTLAFVMFAGLTYGIGASIIISVLSIGAGGVLIYLKQHGMLPVQLLEYSELNILSDFAVYISLTCLFTGVALRRISLSTKRFEAELAERLKTEQELLRHEVLYQSITHSSMDGFWILDGNGRVQDVNDAYCRMSGYSRDELMAMSVADVSALEDQHQFNKHIREIKAEGAQRFETRHRRKDGSIIDVEVNTVYTSDAGVVVAYLRDVTARNRADKANRIYAHTLESISEIATITDLDDHLTFVNDAFVNIYGYSREEIIGRHIGILWSPNNSKGLLEDILSHKKVGRWQGTILNITKDGREFPISLTTSEVRDETGTIIGLVGISEDISERQKLQQQLLQSQKLESLGTLTGGIAHDFNNLLAMILGSAELLQLQIAAQPQLKKHVDRIVEASERGRSISRQLLIFSRPDEAELKPISLSTIIAGLKDMLQHFLPKTITIKADIEVEQGIVMGDAGQIHQALLNLALNAGDAMTNSGMLTIREYSPSPEYMMKRFGEAATGAYIGIVVSDTGTGMDESLIAKIFDPFFSTKERGKGTGLGLAIVHGIVKNHRGFIDVDSVPGEGTSISLFFPAVVHEVIHQHAADVHAGEDRTGTVLLVDDEKLLREMLADYLAGAGYEVHTSTNGAEGLALYIEHHDAIDVVITDLGMPEMGGEELYKELRKINPGVKVIVSSGYLDGTTKNDLLAMGIEDVLTKPFKIQDINAAVNAAMSSRRA
jgi:PAS domain S-box-containing protein